MKVYSHSEQGKRSYQEDRLLVASPLFTVCDGMGGHPNGDLAAEKCVETLSLSKNDVESSQDPCGVMIDSLRKADQSLKDEGDYRGTTATSVLVDEEQKLIFVSHVGDSRASLFKADGTVVSLTVDHNDFWGYITSFIGGMTHVHREAVEYEEGDILLINSDGVSIRTMSNELLRKQINQSLDEDLNPAEDLCHLAISMGSTDNCTAIVIVL